MTTQTVILASGTAANSSSSRSIAAGVEFKVCAYTTGAAWPDGGYLTVEYDTPGDDQVIVKLTKDAPGVRMVGPITYIVHRNPQFVALAAIEET
jgi:hypothetical protein